MPWLPCLHVGDHAFTCALTGDEFWQLFDAVGSHDHSVGRETESQIEAWLLRTPAALLWTLASVDRATSNANAIPRDYRAAAQAFLRWSARPDVTMPLETGVPIQTIGCRLTAAGQLRFFNFLHDCHFRLTSEQSQLAQQFILEALEFPVGDAGRATRQWLRDVLQDFRFKTSSALQVHVFRTSLESRQVDEPIESCAVETDDQASLRRWATRTGQLLETARRARLNEATLTEEKLAALRQLAYGASHEINNPLANISTRAQLLLADETDSHRRRHLASIYAQAMRAHEMICDMMLFAHPPQPQLRPVELAALLKSAVDDWIAAHPDSSWTLQLCPDVESGVWVEIDRNLIHSLLHALIQNASESQHSGTVRLCAQSDSPERVQLVMEDNGPGMSAAARRHAFDPFYSGREAGRGLGFGLPKAWMIARLNRGELRVAETSSAGTRMILELPRTDRPD